MEKVHKFKEDLMHHAIKFMEKEVSKMHPREIDYLAGICDLHNHVCEFIEIIEKDGDYHISHSGSEMWGDNPRRRRR